MGISIPQSDFSYVYKQFDGPLYIIPAKTAYNPVHIQQLDRDGVFPHNPSYFAAHLPLYPFFIYLGSFFLGYLKSMLGVNMFFTILFAFVFYTTVKKLKLTEHPLLLSSVMLFLPRFLVVRTTGAPESLFMLCILVSLLAFEKKKYWLAGIAGAFATMTKMPGILLFVAYVFTYIESLIKKEKWNWNWLGIFLIPLGLIGVFGIYAIQYNDFFAYFHTGGVVPMPYPFSVFNSRAQWVGTAWLEDTLFFFGLYILTTITFWKSKLRSFFYFSFVFIFATLFVQHRDISRYSLPLWPLACIAFERLFTSKKYIVMGMIILFGIYMYTWNFMTYNIMPISEWLPFL